MAGDIVKRKLAKMSFSGKTRARIYRKLASFLKNGTPLPEALRILHSHATDDGAKPNDTLGFIYMDWINKVNNGQSFGRAVSDWVPSSDRIVIEAGESAGSLAGALENALFIQESGKKIRSTIMAGVAYPGILVALACMLLVIFGMRIVPAFNEVLPREKWTGTAATMAVLSDYINTYLFPALFAFLVVIGVVFYTFPRWVGPVRAKFDKFPPWSLYRLNSGAGFMLSTSALVKAGVQVPEILRLLMRGASPWYYERISEALRHVNNGINLGEALYRTNLGFPDQETVKDLRSYASFANFDENLEKLGRQWIEDSVDKVKTQMSVLKNASLVMLGLVFATIATGIFALQQQVTSAT